MPTRSSQPPGTDAGDLIRTLLLSLGRRSDAESYLRFFRQLSQESFALLVLDEEVARSSSGLLAQHVGLLAQLGLYVCLALDFDELASSQAVLDALHTAGLRAEPVTLTPAEPQERTRAMTAAVDRVRQLLRQRGVPVARFAAAQSSEQERTIWLAQLRAGLGSSKLVFVRASGALGRQGLDLLRLRDEHLVTVHDEGVSVVNLLTDYEVLLQSSALDSKDRALLARVRSLLRALTEEMAPARIGDPSLMVNVTSPPNLLRELFTVRGAGTLIKTGTAILRPPSYDEVDLPRLQQLLETTFQRRLRPQFFANRRVEIYLEEHYRGVALVDVSGGIPLLTKFAVERLAQGEGIGRDLWDALRRVHGVLCWRCRAGNPIAEWYATLCDQMVRTEAWTVFGVGLTVEQIEPTVRAVLARPEDFHASAETP